MKVKDKVIVVTGAGSGMGRELTIQLVNKGAKIAAVDLNMESLNQTEAIAGLKSISKHELNITDYEHLVNLPNAVIEKHGQVDGLINNAGIIQPFVNVKDLDFSIIEKIFNVNFYGTLRMTKAFLPYLLERPEAHIANVSSMGGFIPFPGQTIYSASKAAVKIFSEGLYSELKGSNVNITVFFPGAVNTNIMANSGVEIGSANTETHKTLSASDAASIMIDGIERNKLHVMVGNDAKLLNILYRLSPRMAINMIVNKMKDLKN